MSILAVVDQYMIYTLLAGFFIVANAMWFFRHDLIARPRTTYHLGVILCIGAFLFAQSTPNYFESQRVLIATLYVALGLMMMSAAFRVENPGRALRARQTRLDQGIALRAKAMTKQLAEISELRSKRMAERHREMKTSKLMQAYLRTYYRDRRKQRERSRINENLDDL
jgi:hypothetical protein